jgi:hypothetical protein
MLHDQRSDPAPDILLVCNATRLAKHFNIQFVQHFPTQLLHLMPRNHPAAAPHIQANQDLM